MTEALAWAPTEGETGVKHASYKGRTLTVAPGDAGEFDGWIDGEHHVGGYEEFGPTAALLMEIIDKGWAE